MTDIPPHLLWLHARYGVQLTSELARRDHVDLEPDAAIAAFGRADPTPGLKLADWLVRTYVDKATFRFEDIRAGLQSTVGTTLALFVSKRGTLPPDRRNINLYDSPGALWQAVGRDVAPKPSKREDRDRARDESLVLVDDDRGIVAIPLTEYAACWWGRGTRWCTAAREGNAFHGYARSGPLFILIPPGGEKAQFYCMADSCDLMNAADNPVSASHLACLHELLDPIIGWLSPVYGHVFQFGSPTLRSNRRIVLQAVTSHAHALTHADQDYLDDDEIVAVAVAQEGALLGVVSQRLRSDRKLALHAVRHYSGALAYFSRDIKEDRTVVLEASARWPRAIHFANETLRNDQDFIKALLDLNGMALQHIPEKFSCNREMVMRAIANTGEALKFASIHLRNDKEIVMSAVLQKGAAIQGALPKLWEDPEVIYAALSNDGGAIRFLGPDARSNRENALLALTNNGLALQHVSPELQCNPEVVIVAVKRNGGALAYAHPSLRQSRSIVLAAVMNDGWALSYAHSNMQNDPEIVMTAVRQAGMTLANASQNLRDNKDIVLAALENTLVSFRTWTFRQASARLQQDADVLALAGMMEQVRYNYDLAGLKWPPVAKILPQSPMP